MLTSRAARRRVPRLLFWLGVWCAAAAGSTTGATAQQLDKDNIYAEDVRRATAALERAHERLAAAERALNDALARIPAAQKDYRRAAREATKRQRLASAAIRRADEAERLVVDRREKAAAQVAAAAAAEAGELREWRAARARWIGITAAVFAVTAAGIAAIAAAVRRSRGDIDQDRLADVVGLTIGVGIAAYLCGILGALQGGDAWTFSWWVIGGAAIGVVGTVAALVAAWKRPRRLAQLQRKLGRAAFPVALIALALAAAPATAAVTLRTPEGPALSAETRRLAADLRANAPMPAQVQRLRQRANRLEGRARSAKSRADRTLSTLSALLDTRDEAQRDINRANTSITRWTAKLEAAKNDYDDYQDLLDIPDIEIPDVDIPDLEDEYGDETGLDDLPDVPSYTPPTTEDFGSGRGRIGLCEDGTLSDSIGRPGACSHHGGVAG